MSTEIPQQQQFLDNNSISGSNMSSCTPRNALFCCSSPVCLNNSTAPRILPVDYEQCMDSSILLVPSEKLQLHHQQDQSLDSPQEVIVPLSVPDLAKFNFANSNGIIINDGATDTNIETKEVTNTNLKKKYNTPPPNVKLGVLLKKVAPPKSTVTVKKIEGPMLGVVLRKVEKKVEPQKSILEDDKPLYHLSIVRTTDNNSKSSSAAKPKPPEAKKPATSVATASAADAKKKTELIATTAATGVKVAPIANKPPNHATTASAVSHANKKPTAPTKQPRLPITVQKIEGDKIIIIKKIQVPKNGKLPPHLLHLQDDVQKRISTYDFPIYCENKITIRPTTQSTSAQPSVILLSPQIIQNPSTPDTITTPKPVEKSKNSLHNQKNESNTSTSSARNELQSKAVSTRSPTSSSMSLSSSSPSESPPHLMLSPPERQKAINELARILNTENLNNHNSRNRNVQQQQQQQKPAVNCKFPPGEDEACSAPTMIKSLTNQAGESAAGKLSHPTDTHDLYIAEIDYMNNYLRSLPDYNELDKKIHKEFQKCEDIYDQIQSINTGIAAKNQSVSANPRMSSQFSFPGQQSKNVSKDNGSVMGRTIACKPAYPSIFSTDKNKLTRSVSSSSMMAPQNYPIDHPDIPGFLPKLPQNSSGCLFKYNKNGGGIQKSSSNSCLTRPMGKQLMNNFWTENVVDKSKKKSGWNYAKIMAPTTAESKKGFSVSNPNENKLRKDLSLSNIDSTIRENISKEDLYKLICNDGGDEKKVVTVQQKIPVKISQKEIENIPGFMNLNKSVSLSSMPGLSKSGSKSMIPCYMKPVYGLNKSTSNSQLPLRQIFTNQIVGESQAKKIEPTHKTGPEKHDFETQPFKKGVLKSSSSSCVFGSKYQPFQRKEEQQNNSWNMKPSSYSSNDKILRNNEGNRQAQHNKQNRNNHSVKPPFESQIVSQKFPHFPSQTNTHSNKQPALKTQTENTPLARVSSSVHISIGGGQPHLAHDSFKHQNTFQPTQNTHSSRLAQQSLPNVKSTGSRNHSYKVVTEADLQNSKKQKEAENNIEKCLNQMLRITSNYAVPPTANCNTKKPNESHQPVPGQKNQHQHKPFPIGKSNSASNVRQHLYHPLYQDGGGHHGTTQMRQNKKQMPAWNVTGTATTSNPSADHKNLLKGAPPVQSHYQPVPAVLQHNQNVTNPAVKYYQQKSAANNNVVVMPTGLQKSATSGNIRKEIATGGNKPVGNVDVYNSISYVVASAAPQPSNSLSSSSYAACPGRKKTSSSVGKTSNSATVLKPQNGDKVQSDILRSFGPYHYQNQQQAPGHLIQPYGDQFYKQNLAYDPSGRSNVQNHNVNNAQIVNSAIIRPNQPLIDLPAPTTNQHIQQHQQLLPTSLLGYDYPQQSLSQSSSYYDSSCDIANSSDFFEVELFDHFV